MHPLHPRQLTVLVPAFALVGCTSPPTAGSTGESPGGGLVVDAATTTATDGATESVGDSGSKHDAAPGTDGSASAPDAPDAALPFPFAFDVPNIVRSSNLIFSKPNLEPSQFIPLGNGTLGAAVWGASGLTAQLNRVDTFPNRQSLGQLNIPGLSALTGASDFSARLDLYDATLVETGGGITATIFIRADAPEMVIDVTGANPSVPLTATFGLWTGRSPTALASGSLATLAETWQDSTALSGQGASGETFGVLTGITVDGTNVSTSVQDTLTVAASFSPHADGSFRIVLAAPSWTGGDATTTATTTLGSDATTPIATLMSHHLSYWNDYWGRIGLLKVTSADGAADYMEALRTLYLYLTAAESRGTLPGSQAGLGDLFDYLKDTQPWLPAAYWFWNTRMMVAANMTSGAFEMNSPVFNLYTSNVANLEAWTTSKMGASYVGICVPETMRFNGNGYWYGGESNASCDVAASPSYNALTITSGAEVGLWVWQQYLMTGDLSFLTTNYPVMSEAAQFLLSYATKGSDGLLHTVANAHETQWDVQDPVTDIVAMNALFPAVISAATLLGQDSALVAQLTTALTELPPLPRTDPATHTQLLTAAYDDAGTDVIALSYEPDAAQHNGENLDLEAVWPYGLIGDNGSDTALATRTYAHRMFVNNADWSADAIQAARLGLASEVATDLVNLAEKYQGFACGLALLGGGTNDGTSEPYIEQTGITAAALNEALAQDYDGLLRIAPAWPSGWSGSGTIFIQGNSKVSVNVEAGAVTIAVVEAGSAGSLRVRNPWPSGGASVVDGITGATAVPATKTSTFTIPTISGHWYAIVPASTGAALPHVAVTGTPATSDKTLGSSTTLGM